MVHFIIESPNTNVQWMFTVQQCEMLHVTSVCKAVRVFFANPGS